MSFTNVAVDLKSLPRYDEAPLRRLDPRFPRLVLAVASLVALPGAIAAVTALIVAPPIGLPLRLLLAAVVLSVVGFAVWLPYRWASTVRYAVRQHDVIRRAGLFWTTETVQPIKRIQHVEREQGPLEKRFGLSTIKLYSAGSGNVTLRIPGLEAETAAALCRYILSFHEPEAWAAPPEPPAELPADG